MQQDYGRRYPIFLRPILFGLSTLALLTGASCIERPTTIDPAPDQPFQGITLNLAASNPDDRAMLHQLSRGWASRTGAKVQISPDPWNGSADIGLLSQAEMPRWAEANQLAEVPLELKRPTNPYRWGDLNPIESIRLTTWGKGTYALPVIGEGMVLVYRTDAFEGRSAPATWEEMLESANKLGPNSLPPLSADPERLSAEFFTAAACYDRLAVGRIGNTISDDFFAFQFDPATGAPRLDKPAFRHVAELFRNMQRFRGSATDIATAFRSGEAKLGILSLKELGQLGPETTDQLSVAPLPGSRVTFDAKDRPQPTDQGSINRVPYLGWGGRVGVVSATCSSPEAAWDLLAELGMPERTALDLIASPKLGAGPYRTSHLDHRARPRWFAYGLSATETERLTAALRDNLGPTVQNYRVRLRTPNQHELQAILDAELRSILKSEQPANTTRLNDRWKTAIEKLPPEEWKRVLRKSMGLS